MDPVRSKLVQSAPSTALRADDPPEAIGRYRIVRRLGEGGMGVVWLADDPLLARRVAVKLQRADAPADDRRRALREGRALAAVAHPNVLPVFEAGVVDGRAFIVTEHVDGVTLRAWLAARRRSPAEILAIFRAAGRGLAALHAVGLVHCDFKPDNVLISEQAGMRVLVCDLGLAAPQPDDTADGNSPIDVTIRVGMAFGTARYMAPEQHRGERLDPRADQYAFCIALFEALYRDPPFFSLEIRELYRFKHAGLPPQQRDPEHPRSYEVLRRGLSPDPNDRFRDMDELLAALAAAGRAKTRWLFAVPVAMVAALGWLPAREPAHHLGASVFGTLDDAIPRVHAEELLEEALDAERASDLEQSIALNERAYEVALADHDDAMLALSAATMLRRAADFRRDAQLNQLWRGRAESALALAPDELRAWHEYDEGLFHMELRAGHYDAASTACEAMLVRAREDPIDGASAEIAALEFRGDLHIVRGDPAAADATGAALVDAVRQSFGNDQNQTARALLSAAAWATRNGDSDRALVYVDEAAQIYARLDGPDHVRNLHLWMVRGWALAGLYDNAAAFASLAEAAALRERWTPEAVGLKAEIDNTMGALARRMHDYERARQLHYAALVATEAEYGADATAVGSVLHNLAILEHQLGNCPKARELARNADDMHAKRGLPTTNGLRTAMAEILAEC